MNITALLMIGISFALVGRYLSYRMTVRVNVLEKIDLMFTIISNEICYVCMPSDEIARLLCKKSDLKDLTFLKKCVNLIDSGEDFPVAWKMSLEDKNNTLFIRKKDVELLKAFGENFGVTDVEGQVSLCKLYEETLRLHHAEAIREKERFSGPATILGLLCGIGVIVVFL